MGHVARGADAQPPLASSVVSGFRDLEWWSREQQHSVGRRHNGRFQAKLGPFDAKMNAVV